MAFPSGRQFELRRGRQRAVAVEVGGTLRAYQVDGFDVLEGFAEDEMATNARGTPLVPWPNRIRDGRYSFGGEAHQLALTEPGRRNAIHGLARWVRWEATKKTAERVVLQTVIHPQPGYEFTVAVTATYALTAGGLEVRLAGRNLGSRPAPFGAGHHPYLRTAGGLVDETTLACPFHARLLVDRRGIPTGEVRPVSGRYDFRRPRRIGRTVLDAPLLDAESDRDGLARVVLEGAERRVTLWMDGGFPYVMLFTGDTLAPARRRRGLAVEPMTCAPDAFNNGLGLVTLEPGQSHMAHWGLAVI